VRRYRRVQEAIMETRKPEDVVFDATASCTLLAAGTAIATLLYQLITAAVPLLQSMVFRQVLMATGF